MNGKKIAILLDFDGPLFRNDLVKSHLLRTLNIDDTDWDRIYKEAKMESSYVRYDYIIGKLSELIGIDEGHMWKVLDKLVRSPIFFPEESKEAIQQFKKMGHVELVTQGDRTYQDAKLKASGIYSFLPEKDIHIIEKNKNEHLQDRAGKLIELGYDVIMIDDRPKPLKEVWNAYPEHVMPIRINIGKYIIEKNVDFDLKCIEVKTIAEAQRYVVERFQFGQEGLSARMRR